MPGLVDDSFIEAVPLPAELLSVEESSTFPDLI